MEKTVTPIVTPLFLFFVLYETNNSYGLRYIPKSGVNKQEKASLYYLVKSGSKQHKRGLSIKVAPSDFDARRFLINSKAENAHIYNERLSEINNKLRKAWSLYESETYSWDEMIAFLSGAKTTLDVWSFCETVIQPNQTKDVYKGVKDAYGAVRKVIGRELTFEDLTYNTVDTCVKDWKNGYVVLPSKHTSITLEL